MGLDPQRAAIRRVGLFGYEQPAIGFARRYGRTYHDDTDSTGVFNADYCAPGAI